MTRHVYTTSEVEWLQRHYREDGATVEETLDAFEMRFGWRPERHRFIDEAHRVGVTRRFCFKPDMDAWLSDNSGHMGAEELHAAFCKRFRARVSRRNLMERAKEIAKGR